ncbi:hypothetical protein BH18ACI2_BH18ACI2_25430 [soil metagenome]
MPSHHVRQHSARCSVDGNEITVSITPATKAGEPAQVNLVPPTDYVRVVNDTETITRGEKSTLGVTRGLSDNEVRVWGAFPLGQPSSSVRLSVHRPALWAAQLFRAALITRGISVEGGTRARDAKTRALIAAKTGTLTYTNSLSGYLTTADGEPMAFSILCNDETGRAPATCAIAAIAETMTAYPFD